MSRQHGITLTQYVPYHGITKVPQKQWWLQVLLLSSIMLVQLLTPVALKWSIIKRLLTLRWQARATAGLDRQTDKQTLGQLGKGLGLLQSGQRDWRQLDPRDLSLSDTEREEGGLGTERRNRWGWDKGAQVLSWWSRGTAVHQKRGVCGL